MKMHPEAIKMILYKRVETLFKKHGILCYHGYTSLNSWPKICMGRNRRRRYFLKFIPIGWEWDIVAGFDYDRKILEIYGWNNKDIETLTDELTEIFKVPVSAELRYVEPLYASDALSNDLAW